MHVKYANFYTLYINLCILMPIFEARLSMQSSILQLVPRLPRYSQIVPDAETFGNHCANLNPNCCFFLGPGSLSFSVLLSLSSYLYVTVSLSVCPSLFLYVCQHVCLSVCLSICLSVCLSVSLLIQISRKIHIR